MALRRLMQVGGEGLRTVWIYYKTVTKKKIE